METHATERKAVRSEHGAPPQPEPEHLPCPRCNSTNTKFCYYNNYNFSQPRHFCKSCRRYWTRGGALRDIPVGGGIRKNTKRSPRTVASAVALSTEHDGGGGGVSQLRSPFAFESDHGVGAVVGSFISFLSTQEAEAGAWTVGGYGYGFGLDDAGFGLRRSFWPVYGLVDVGPDSGSTSLSSVAGMTRQGNNEGAGV